MSPLVELAMKLLEQSLRDGGEPRAEAVPRTLEGPDRLTISVTEAAELLGISRALACELVAQ